MTDYTEKKAAALKRIELLKADAVRVTHKIEEAEKLVAECDRMLEPQVPIPD